MTTQKKSDSTSASKHSDIGRGFVLFWVFLSHAAGVGFVLFLPVGFVWL